MAAPRYLIVLEASFPKGDPSEDTFSAWKKTLENDPDCPCEGIRFRQMELISTVAEGAEVWPQSERDPYRQRWPAGKPDSGIGIVGGGSDPVQAQLMAAIALSRIPGRLGDAVAECERAVAARPGFDIAERFLQQLKRTSSKAYQK